ncbi:hypothetical protein [Streptomyces sp. CC224B]|uniref:hypothetical protein n=1 Tax=Streptomyces sp. CC224B TaxID=3044571 RepID=UPI0024A9C4A8|nr:hypothetical protein [Streptomyces sp. CC224B]
MLRVVYQAADLTPGKLSGWREDRGLLEISVARGVQAQVFIPSLNATLLDLVSKAQWYQLWEGEIISADHPQSPVRCTFAVSPFRSALPVEIREHKGHVALYVPPTATIDDIEPVLNRSIAEFLDGRQWFQVWRGEIVTMDSPEMLPV